MNVASNTADLATISTYNTYHYQVTVHTEMNFFFFYRKFYNTFHINFL